MLKPNVGGRGSRWPLIVALALSAAVALVGAVVALMGRHPSPTASPTPSGVPQPPGPSPRSTFFDLTPAPTARPVPLASSVSQTADVVYLKTHSLDQGTLEAVDWSGHVAGSVTVDRRLRVNPSPNGRWLLLDDSVFRSDGAFVLTLPFSGLGSVWASDSSHLCTLTSGPTVAVASVPDGQTRSVKTGDLNTVDPPALLACNISDDRLLMRTRHIDPAGPGLAIDLVSVALSTGAVTQRLSVCAAPHACAPVQLAAAPDARTAVSGGGTEDVSRIDTVRGTRSRIGSAATPVAVSGDGRRVVVQLDDALSSSGSGPGGVALIDLSGGATLWQQAGVVTADYFVLARAGRPEVMVGISPRGALGNGGIFPPGPVTLLLLDTRGSAVVVRSSVADVAGTLRG